MYTISCRILTPFCICCFSVVGPPPVFKTFVHNVVTVVRLSTRSSPSHLVISSKSSPVSPLRYSHLSEACSLKQNFQGKPNSLIVKPIRSQSNLPLPFLLSPSRTPLATKSITSLTPLLLPHSLLQCRKTTIVMHPLTSTPQRPKVRHCLQ